MSDPDEIWLRHDKPGRWYGFEYPAEDTTAYIPADLAKAREKALADALRSIADREVLGENWRDPDGGWIYYNAVCNFARAVLAAHDKRKGGDDG